MKWWWVYLRTESYYNLRDRVLAKSWWIKKNEFNLLSPFICFQFALVAVIVLKNWQCAVATTTIYSDQTSVQRQTHPKESNWNHHKCFDTTTSDSKWLQMFRNQYDDWNNQAVNQLRRPDQARPTDKRPLHSFLERLYRTKCALRKVIRRIPTFILLRAVSQSVPGSPLYTENLRSEKRTKSVKNLARLPKNIFNCESCLRRSKSGTLCL